MTSLTGPVPGLDEVNLRLLAELQTDPRLSMSELGRRVGMSAPAVTERVQRLEAAGVIVGYRLELDPAALGLPVAAVVRIRPGPGLLTKLADAIRETAEVVECHRITGEDCFVLKMHAPSIGDLESLLDTFLMFGQTTTSIVVATPVPPRPLPLPAPPRSPRAEPAPSGPGRAGGRTGLTRPRRG
ncbi:Lrp/AsnC family transcriptional regulator [Plantactinospora siamensis]|uniref:Lrp/AsnC family transcriptional regulator n=1 Tax=Plantactinospora siamensis TaxID=555372 RepID=A0ABV6P2E5_9ACTN